MQTVVTSDGRTIVVHDLGGHGEPLLISHCTGFHGRAYRALAADLGATSHVFAVDHRGHGDSEEPAERSDLWRSAGRDMISVAAALAASSDGPILGFGHSMGATALLLAEHLRPGTFRAIVAYEPIIFPPDPPTSVVAFEQGLIAATRRRRPEYASMDEAIANFSAKPPLNRMMPDAIDAYVRFGMRPTEAGTVALKCQPEFEADMFTGARTHGLWELLPAINCPVLMLAGEAANASVGTLTGQHSTRLPNGHFESFADLSHFGPFEDPTRIASRAREFFELAGTEPGGLFGRQPADG